MNLLEVRKEFVRQSGYRALVTNWAGSDFSDNGANFYINSGLRWLNRRSPVKGTLRKYTSTAVAGDWEQRVPNVEHVKMAVLNNGTDIKRLTYKNLDELIDMYGEPFSGIDQGEPAYWAWQVNDDEEDTAVGTLSIDVEPANTLTPAAGYTYVTTACSISGDGNYAAVGVYLGAAHSVVVYDLSDGSTVCKIDNPDAVAPISSCSLNSDGSRVAFNSLGAPAKVYVYSVSGTPSLLWSNTYSNYTAQGVSFSPNDSYLIMAEGAIGVSSTVRLYSAHTGALLQSKSVNTDEFSFSWSSSGSCVLAVNLLGSSTFTMLSVPDLDEVFTSDAGTGYGYYNDGMISPDCATVLYTDGTDQKKTQVWDVASEDQIDTITMLGNLVPIWLSDTYIMFVGSGGYCVFYDYVNGEIVEEFMVNSVTGNIFTNTTATMFAVLYTDSAKLWEIDFAETVSEEKNIIILPPADDSYTIDWYGDFSNDEMEDDDDSNWWSEEAPELLIRAARLQLELDGHRNVSGMKAFQGQLEEEIARMQAEHRFSYIAALTPVESATNG